MLVRNNIYASEEVEVIVITNELFGVTVTTKKFAGEISPLEGRV